MCYSIYLFSSNPVGGMERAWLPFIALIQLHNRLFFQKFLLSHYVEREDASIPLMTVVQHMRGSGIMVAPDDIMKCVQLTFNCSIGFDFM